MAIKKYKYKTYDVSCDDQSDSLSINGKAITISKHNSKYLTNELPYQYFNSLEEIAESIIDNSPNY